MPVEEICWRMTQSRTREIMRTASGPGFSSLLKLHEHVLSAVIILEIMYIIYYEDEGPACPLSRAKSDLLELVHHWSRNASRWQTSHSRGTQRIPRSISRPGPPRVCHVGQRLHQHNVRQSVDLLWDLAAGKALSESPHCTRSSMPCPNVDGTPLSRDGHRTLQHPPPDWPA